MLALDLGEVRFKYRDAETWALDGISLGVEKGEFVTLLGANGAGKSTLCLLSNGLIPHALRGTLEGRAKVFGMDVSKHSVAELSSMVGIVFQEPESQLFCMSVEEEVAFGPENLAVPRDEIRERVEWALEVVGMKGYNSRSPFSLSGGQKQRVAIAAALAMRPELLVLDEPAHALDPVAKRGLYTLLRDLKERQGITVLLADHDAEEAAAYSDRIVLMSDGKVVGSGPPREVMRNADLLSSIGLEPPQMAKVAALLNSRIPGAGFGFTSIDEAEKAIDELLRSRGRGGTA